MRAFADEVVVVDTGSTDDTIRIARDRGARVLDFEWRADYAAARNHGLAAISADWVLCLDADERLVGGAALREAIRSAPPAVGAFQIGRIDLVRSPETGEPVENPVAIVRVLRRHPAIRYVGSIHERPQDTVLAAGLEIGAVAGAHLEHRVLATPEDRLRAKQERYLAMLERALEESPDDAWYGYYRAKTLWYLRRVAEARRTFEDLAGCERVPRTMRASAACSLAVLLVEEGHPDEALAWIARARGLCPDRGFVALAAADVAYGLGRFEQALSEYRRVATSPVAFPRDDFVVSDPYFTPQKKAYRIGSSLLALGRLPEAAAAFEEGLAAAPAHPACRFGLATLRALESRFGEAAELLRACAAADPAWSLPREFLARLGAAGV